LASAELDEADESKRPSVQIGDPFEESKLVECCLELLDAGLLVSLQDLGAAGLTSSSGEMASGGGVGIDIDVARVPLRAPDMEPGAPAAPIYPAPTRTLQAEEPNEVLLALLASPNLASRRPLFEQYDSIVQSRTVRRPEESDAAVLQLPDGSALAVSIDGNGR